MSDPDGARSTGTPAGRGIDKPNRYALAERLRSVRTLHPESLDLAMLRTELRTALRGSALGHPPDAPEVMREWVHDGVHGQELGWSTGWGEPTAAFLLRPVGEHSGLPGVLALHCHGGSMYFGKDKIADGPEGLEPALLGLRESDYGGRAFANELARRGNVVLVHDAYPWGSRRVALEDMQGSLRDSIVDPGLEPIAFYDRVARDHENLIEKHCRALGSSFAEVVLSEDLIALRHLAAVPEVDATRMAAVGLSGGGCRAALISAFSDDIKATVVAGMMSTHADLIDHIAMHTWMFFPPGLAESGDWPDLIATRAPSPLLVQYCEDDEFFPLEGMHAAHERIARHYARARAEAAYTGTFHPGHHRFDVAMQDAAFTWLEDALK